MPYPFTGSTANPWNYGSNQNAQYIAPQAYPISQPSQNTFVRVQGEQSAKSYPVAPGNQVLLFDSDESVFYIKKADQSGRPLPLEIYDFKRRETTDVLPDAKVSYAEFATKEDVRTIIKEELESFRSSQSKARNYKEANK